MTADIKPGDLVMVVRPTLCCNSSLSIGDVGIVAEIPSWADCTTCSNCGFTDSDLNKYRAVRDGGCHVSRLKKIDPPALADEVERVRELEAI